MLLAGVLAPAQAVFANPERALQVQAYDQVFRFIEGVKGKETARRYTPLILASAKKHGLDPLLVANLVHTESSFNPKAVSPMGAIGLMQVMPLHYRKHGIPASKWHDPAINLDLGCQIYASYFKMMEARYPGLSSSALHHRALVAYNMGPRAVISRGIYRSRYSQKVASKVEQLSALPKAARPLQPKSEPRSEDATPVRWEELPLSSTTLSLAFPQEANDPLRVGHPIPETLFALPDKPSFLP